MIGHTSPAARVANPDLYFFLGSAPNLKVSDPDPDSSTSKYYKAIKISRQFFIIRNWVRRIKVRSGFRFFADPYHIFFRFWSGSIFLMIGFKTDTWFLISFFLERVESGLFTRIHNCLSTPCHLYYNVYQMPACSGTCKHTNKDIT